LTCVRWLSVLILLCGCSASPNADSAISTEKGAVSSASPCVIGIETLAPGAGSAIVEVAITAPIEQAMQSLSGAKAVRSTSSPSRSYVEIEFDGPSSAESAAKVQSALEGLQGSLPAAALPPVVTVDGNPVPLSE
jgi:multidrug efflux pump subunit AcrB